MQRGEVWWVRFGPAVGGEIQKERAAIIVSNDASNQAMNRLQIVPVTSNTSRLFPNEAYVTLNGKQSKAMADQLTTASKERFINQTGRVSASDMQRMEQAIKI